MAISIQTIRDRFTGQNQTTYQSGTTNYASFADSNFYNLGFYRAKYYYRPSTNAYVQFPNTSSAIAMSIWETTGATGNCLTACACACVCSDCGDGSGGGSGGGDAGE